MSKQGALLFALSLLAGVVVGWLGKNEVPKSAAARSSGTTREAGAASPKWEQRDFIAAFLAPHNRNGSRYAEALSDWSVEELRSALDECMHGPEATLSLVRLDIFPQLMGNWMKREPDAVLAWFDGIDPPVLRRRVAYHLASLWPVERADEGFAYFLAHRDLFDPDSTTFQDKVIRARANEGPDAVFAALQQFHAEKVLAPDVKFELPDGFDFASLLARDLDALVTDKEQARADSGYRNLFRELLILSWYAQDREQAFDWLLKEQGVDGLEVISTSTEKEDHFKWLSGKIAELAPEQQDEFLATNREKWLYEMGNLLSFAAGTTDPALRKKLEAFAVDGVAYGNIEPTLAVIAANPDLGRRLEILEQTPIGPRPDKRRSSFYDGEYLRKTLGEWGAEPARIDAIIARFQQHEASLR
jgi:hypothetical protein